MTVYAGSEVFLFSEGETTDYSQYESLFDAAAPNITDAYEGEIVIGILAQPVHESKKRYFNYSQFIIKGYENIATYSGVKTKTIPIDYNIPSRELKKILKSINGVIVPDGGLNIINATTGRLHQFYRTTRRIVKYSMELKD